MKCRFSLARSHNLVEKTNREPAVAKKRTWEENLFRYQGNLKREGGVSQIKEKVSWYGEDLVFGDMEEF